jgi:hypothetical protein
MAAPAGINEGTPQDPMAAGGAGVEVADAPTAGADTTKPVPAQAEPADTAPADTARPDTAQAEAKPSGVIPAEVTPAGVVPAGVVPAPAEPVGEGLVAAPGEKPAETAPGEPGEKAAETAPAEASLAETAPAETEPRADDPGPADGEHAEADADEPDWDAGEKSRNVSPLAIIGIIVGLIALVGVAVGVLDVLTHGFRPKTVITYRPAAVFGLRPGECINSGANGLNVTVVSCKTPHDAEVFATFRLPATGWPGTSTVQQDAGNGCASLLGGYLNPALATADLTQEFVYPDEAAWKAGERTVICEVSAASGPLTGSVRAKG